MTNFKIDNIKCFIKGQFKKIFGKYLHIIPIKLTFFTQLEIKLTYDQLYRRQTYYRHLKIIIPSPPPSPPPQK